MKIKIITIMAFLTLLAISTAFAEEPTWLFTVPKAESLKEGHYNIGLLYFDFGIAENLEVGIHGVKYSMDKVAIGASLFPFLSPYIVFSPDIGSSELLLGVKAAPYIFFAGFEAPLSNNLKIILELNNGLNAGVRILPARNWTLDLFMMYGYFSVDIYRYKYARIEVKDFNAIPAIQFAYSGRF
ncbi:TPA: hypothetical protein ENS27_18150 [bacterium]|nr:hypothetical protein [bacterium]